MCVAMIHFHRFFVVHSMRIFDPRVSFFFIYFKCFYYFEIYATFKLFLNFYLNVLLQDVAAACLFLAGKSEEFPRKLELISRTWYNLKNDVNEKERTIDQKAHSLIILK